MNATTQLATLKPKSEQTPKHKDPKRYLWLLSPALPLIGLAAATSYAIAPKKLRAMAALGPIMLHGVIPFIDKMVGADAENHPEEAIKQLEQDPYYMRIVKAYIPLQYLTTIVGAYAASRKGTPLIDQIVLGMSVGAVNGIALNTAHELSHKSEKTYHYLSHLALLPTGYIHFRIEHPYGHHKRVATPEDPASSQMGESFWQFWPRTVIGSFKSAIEIETTRLKRRGKGWWSLDNELLQGWAMAGAFHATMIAVFGRRVIPFMATQAVYGFTLFEVINYLEHYGLKRQKLDNGKYERTMPEHSWNNNSMVTNLFLYQLQRHSDHHAFPTRSFQALRHFEDVPQLPAGYASLLLPAIIPSWWFKLMDQRVVDNYKGDLNKANVHVKARARLFAKYGVVDQQLVEKAES
ncbi:alkane 1-monooxygenase [Aquirhabdus sp.]|uniref:alkane 1-monooxygenase n=1 Tax=Aquirhabdus sp. TaxID=2824160 RepID=UPI00396CDD17